MNALGSCVRENLWTEKALDPALDVPPQESCCILGLGNIYKDWTQVPVCGALIVAGGVVGYGVYIRKYEVVALASFVALALLVAFFSIWRLKSNWNLGRNITRIAQERLQLRSQLAERKVQLEGLQNNISDLLKLNMNEREILVERTRAGEFLNVRLDDQNNKVSETEEKYRALFASYEKAKFDLQGIKDQIAKLTSQGKVREEASSRLDKQSDSLKHSTEKLNGHIDRIDQENKEFNGENDEMVGLLVSLKTEVTHLQTYILKLEGLLLAVDQAEEAALNRIKEAARTGDLLSTLEQADARLDRMEEGMQEGMQ